MIVTVTLNAALDVTYMVEGAVRTGETHRVRSVAERAGGKGVNVARVLASLGEPVLALGLAGGAAGAALRADLDAAGVPHRFVDVAASTRRTVAVVDGAGAVTGFWEPGPQVSRDEWAAFVDGFGEAVARAGMVVLSGSLPPGVPVDAYAQLVWVAAGLGVPTLVDADGEALRAALTAQPTLVKPNAEEALRALAGSAEAVLPAAGAAFGTPRGAGAGARAQPLGEAGQTYGSPAATSGALAALDPAQLAQRLVAAGAGVAVVSAGADGVAACWGGRLLTAAPPRVVVGNSTGAGDAASAALALALARGGSPEEALARAVALSAAAVAAPLAGDVDVDVLTELAPLVAVRDLTSAQRAPTEGVRATGPAPGGRRPA